MAIFDLVFEGGGAKGSVFVGALEAFFGAGHTAGRLVGTSAGAITATLLAAGFTPAQMRAAMLETDKATGKPRAALFLDTAKAEELSQYVQRFDLGGGAGKKIALLGGDAIVRTVLLELLRHNEHMRTGFTFLERGGIYSGSTFVGWLEEKLAAVGVGKGCTLGQLREQKRCDLSLIATNTTSSEMLVLNHRTAPGVPVAMAVRMSMSIPFVWAEVNWDGKWGKYNGKDITDHTIVDGGVLSNFPIDLVATDNPRAKEFMGEHTDPHQAGTLGLLIDEQLPVKGFENAAEKKPSLRPITRLQRLVDTMTRARDNDLIRRYEPFICRLPAKGYGTTEFEMPPEKMAALVEAGKQAMLAYLAKLPS